MTGDVRTPNILPHQESWSAEVSRDRLREDGLLGKGDCGPKESVVVVGRTCVSDFCHVPILVEGVPCLALVDTGSTVTVIRPDVIPADAKLEATTVRLRTVTGELAPMKGKGEVGLTIGGKTLRHPVWVATVQDPCILGLDFLKSAGCQLDLRDGLLRFEGGPDVLMSTENNADLSFTGDSPTPLPHTPTDLYPGVATQPYSEPVSSLALREMWLKNREGLDESQQEQFWDLLVEFQHCFAFGEGDVGQTHLAQHEIETGDAMPIRLRPRRLPFARQDAADKALLDMQRAGIIEPSESAWAAPVVMVPKKGGQWRFCVDYRRLNEVTRKDSYPIPRVDESLDLVAGSSWFTSLDLRTGYWQVPLAPDARPKTAFSTGRGLWQFRVLCFGLCNAPATFARLMDRVLSGIPRSECLVYLDDILVHGSSFQSSLEALRRVLDRVSESGLKLHPEKCNFFRREVTFLGHKLGGKGLARWKRRRFVQGFSTLADPLFQLLKKDKSFMWTEECQNSFAALKQALVTAPVLAPPDPTLPFILDTDASGVGMGAVLSQVGTGGERVVAYHSKTFNKSERRYCVTRRELAAVLFAVRHFKYYLCGIPFIVRTDHSALQWLMSFKEPEGQLARWIEELQTYNMRVVHRAGSGHQNADALSRRPCSADGCRYCDKREARDRELENTDVRGTSLGCQQGNTSVCLAVETVSIEDWRRLQEDDADLQPVIQWVQAQQRPPWEEVAIVSLSTKNLWAKFKDLRLQDGVLQREWKDPATGDGRWQVVVPRSLREGVIRSAHGTVGSGHFGVSKTLKRVRQGFYWGLVRRDVEDFCRRCDECTARKGPPGRSLAPLQQFPVGGPMQRVGVDILGPFPRSERGNRFVLTAMDYFTKWPEAYALPDQEAETVVDALVDGMFCRFGVAESIHSDQGRNFESRVFSVMCDKLGIHKTRTTPLHPQSDGLVERFNRTLAEQLAIVTAKHQRDWDMHLPFILMACRSAVQDSTSCTPALLMLGREIRTPGEMAFGRPPDAPVVPPGPDGRVGMGVQPLRKKGRCPKLDSQWIGPCSVLERIGEVVYRVQLPPRGRKVALHRDRLAPYRGGAAAALAPASSTGIPTPEGEAGLQQNTASPLALPASTTPVLELEPLHLHSPVTVTQEGQPRPQRVRRLPGRFRDFVRSLEVKELCEGGAV
ncbi:hypothetical protein QQF64_028778 [Cirrhinus molitorella]|uniref:Gypsy retrotransposon integrase-like protein 1 n=1 Tax=Cirrhinus molitorella TaxID=172907 RepID=A0ABR3N827_9TELE